MPWTGRSIRQKHNKGLMDKQATAAAQIANAILRDTGDEGKAIRVANYRVKRKRRGK